MPGGSEAGSVYCAGSYSGFRPTEVSTLSEAQGRESRKMRSEGQGDETAQHNALYALPSVLAALPFMVLACRVLLHRQNPVYSGDAALLELAVRSAARADRAVGPYSRFDFFHPGPMMFYVLSPFKWVTGGAPWALPLAVDLFNGFVMVLFVLLVQRSTPRWSGAREAHAGAEGPTLTDRRNGLLAGAAAAAVALAYAVAIDLGLLQILWNPLLIMLPVALLLVASAFARSWAGIALIAVAATFALQSNISTAPVVIAASACAVLWLAVDAVSHRRATSSCETDTRRWPARWIAVIAAGIALVAWMPPVAQQLTANTGNFGRIWHFFRSSGEPEPGIRRAVAFAGRELAVFPSRIIWKGSLTADTVNLWWGAIALVGFLGVATTLVVIAVRRQSRPATRLGVVALVGAFAAVYSMASVRGPVYWYIGAYMSAVAVPLLLGWLLLASDRFPIWGPRIVAGSLGVLTIFAVTSAATTPINNNRAFPNESIYRTNTEAAWRVVEPIVGPGRDRVVLTGDTALLPTIAGVALKLEESGIRVRVTAALVPWFGPERLAQRGSGQEISITSGAVPDGYRLVGHAPSRLLGAPMITFSTADF